MGTRRDPFHEAREQARRIRIMVGNEVRGARFGAGLSQGAAGHAVRMSHAQFGRIERAALDQVTVDQLCRACSSVGLKLVVRAYPIADPARDAGQLALQERFRQRLPEEATWATEVPFPIASELRAWDAVAALAARRAAIEAEMRLGDIQALDRRMALKLRDGGIRVLILLVNDTHLNREMLAAHREVLRPRFPLDGRQILHALRRGELPDQSGILML
jgi:hypothetical protein